MKKQQQLQGELKNIPADASQVCCTISSGLNREETLSVQNTVLTCNNLDVNQHQRIGGLKAKVFVLNKEGKPLMPCKPAKARHLLQDKKAEVVSRKPFTIRLLFDCENKIQAIVLGIDPGYRMIGFSARTDKEELVSGELETRKDVSKKIQEKSMYRRSKRNKLWYRQPRFNNRKKKDGWLAPSIKHKLETHLRLVKKIKDLLPISKIIVEIASFDTQKMMNPEISGIEYQQGELQGYEVREYLLEKFNRTCAYCKKQNIPLQIEHIVPKSRGGSNRISNLTIACEKCNKEKNNLTAEEFGFPEIQEQAKQSLKSVACMNSIKNKLVEILDCGSTFGYNTKHDRIKSGLEKSHCNDAFIISGGMVENRCKPFTLTQTRRNNRKLQCNRKGFKPSIRRVRYALQPNDRVWYKGHVFVSNGMHNLGKRIRLTDLKDNKFDVNVKGVKLISHGKGITIC